MSNMHRIIWFDERVRAGKFPNSSMLARQFEISRRQAARDIEYMASSLRAPLQYVAKQRGYCYTNPTFLLPALYMTAEEKQVLKYLAHRYRNYNYEHGDQVRRVASLLERFNEENGESGSDGTHPPAVDQIRLPVFHVQPHILQHMDVLRHAMAHRLALCLDYRDQDGERQVLGMPLRFTSRFHADYVAILPDNADKQQPHLHLHLRLDGILRIRPADFPPATLAAMVQAGEQAYSRASGNTGGSGGLQLVPYEARIQLAAPVAGGVWGGFCAALDDRNGNASSTESAPAADGLGKIYRISFYDIGLFIQHLLVADWERLLSPQWLIERLEKRCSQTLRQLGKGTTDEGR